MTAIGKSSHTTKWVPVKDLSVIWAQAQRKFDQKWAEKIADNFDPDMFGVVSVTKADKNGHFHVIDGQHRVAAIRNLWGEKEQIPCNVFEADSPARAAAIFDSMNTGRKKPQPLEVFKVRVTADREPERSVNEIVAGLGYKVSPANEDGCLSAVGACVQVYRKYGETRLTDCLLVLRGTWGKTRESVGGVLIRGFAEFLQQHDNEVDRQRLVGRVSREFTPARLLGAAKNARDLQRCSLASGVAMVLSNTYNHGLKKGRVAA